MKMQVKWFEATTKKCKLTLFFPYEEGVCVTASVINKFSANVERIRKFQSEIFYELLLKQKTSGYFLARGSSCCFAPLYRSSCLWFCGIFVIFILLLLVLVRFLYNWYFKIDI
ncbi:hypothetical protein GQX74_014370 [Glossina fuscipes]|nr:hypothetical protein GQX74_014370 [Glossina fuscipes]